MNHCLKFYFIVNLLFQRKVLTNAENVINNLVLMLINI